MRSSTASRRSRGRWRRKSKNISRPISCSIAPAVPQQLRERQAAQWDPILAWARDTLGAHFKLGEGIVHVAQPEAALKAAAAAIPTDPWRLGAVHVITTLTGSALIALAMARGALSGDAAWQAAHVDEDWNMAQWGKDEMAMQRRAFRLRRVCGGGRRSARACGMRRSVYPPVTLICRASAGRWWRRSMMKSWPLGLREIASSMAANKDRCLRKRAAACADRRRLPGRDTYKACRCR